MKMKKQITSITHNDLVNLFSTALYGNSLVDADYSNEYNVLFDSNDCFEDKLAKILLNGGEITIIDMESYDNIEDDTHYDTYGTKGANWCSTELIEMTSWLSGDFKVIGYHINLNTLLQSINASDKAMKLMETLLVDEDGDMYTAYNILQHAVFGKVIYG